MLHLSVGLDIYIGFVAFLLGACMGSFLNCTAWRVVHGESPLRGRSHCDVCAQPLAARDLIPILSYILNLGRCRRCGARLSARHVWGEALSGLTFLAIVLRYDISLQALMLLLLACVLFASAFADLEGYIIPDRFIAAGVILRIPFYLLPGGTGTIADSLIGGFAVGGGLLLFVLLYEKIRKLEAMGGGDIKLLFVTGLYLGWAKNLLCLVLACFIGIAFALATQRQRAGQADGGKAFPWGPSISAAAIITALWGDAAIAAYTGLF